MDRAFGFGPKGWGFDSLQARYYLTTMTTETLKKTPLHDDHVILKAKMVPFGGWDMPVQYEGILAEHAQTRSAVTLFDVSHMGEFIVEGDCVKTGLDKIVTMRLSDMPLKTSRYGVILNEAGSVIDDTIVFRIDHEKWFIVVNAGTTDKDKEYFKKSLTPGTGFQDISLQTGKVDVQGPQARDILKKYIADIGKLDYFAFDYFQLLGENVLISRTGYTGELGYEIFFPWEKTSELWNALLKNKEVTPAGLGARDILRLEVGYSLYGHEINEETNPLEAGLSRFIDFEKDFIGKGALLKFKQNGLKRKLVGLISNSRRSPREGNKLFSLDEREIGYVTSGSFSPCLEKGIALGYIDCERAELKQKVFFGNDKHREEAEITGKIFYKKGSIKN